MGKTVNSDLGRGATDAAPGANRFGHFSNEATYTITDYRTPRPWVNMVTNPRFGFAISQTGSGFSWIDNSQLAVITRWEQEFARDSSGKFLYVRDADTGQLWSLAPAPTFPNYDQFTCEHGLGYTTFRTELHGIRAEWTLFVDEAETVELWRVRLENTTDRPRRLEVTGFLEWNCGVQPSPRREFHKLFIETQFDAERQGVFANNHMWDVPSPEYGHWNTDFPYHSVFACTEPILSAQGDKAAFIGQCGDFRQPAALTADTWKPLFGRHHDPVAALRSQIELRAGRGHEFGYVLAVSRSRPSLSRKLERFTKPGEMERSLEMARRGWRDRLAAHRIETPDVATNFLNNNWLRYQAISGRLWGRCGYYQQSGAFGFRDQLQDSQIWLTIDPQRCREQINLHARHQFADGSVYHWWHPLSEQGHHTQMTDDLLWLSYVMANYIRETGDLTILNDATPYVDDQAPHPLHDHVQRAFARVFQRTSARGLPYIGAGDWNDGLSAAGLRERGESIWLGQFLVGLLADWADIYRRAAAARLTGVNAAEFNGRAEEFDARRARLTAAINEHAWDGKWYIRATLDDGSKLGSSTNRVGSIFLNAQTWAILNDVAPPDRAAMCMSAVRQHLVSPAGALLLAPAFDVPDERIGYITRYAPGLRENGGVYTHAATWAIAAACKMRDSKLVGELLTAINPANKNPDAYWAEPYVLPGNVDGPDSPLHGRAGWTWYTGSAAWLPRIVSQHVLGVRPTFDGLQFDPCLPAGWTTARMTRPFRGSTYEIRIERVSDLPQGVQTEVIVDGVKQKNGTLAAGKPGGRHQVLVRCR